MRFWGIVWLALALAKKPGGIRAALRRDLRLLLVGGVRSVSSQGAVPTRGSVVRLRAAPGAPWEVYLPDVETDAAAWTVAAIERRLPAAVAPAALYKDVPPGKPIRVLSLDTQNSVDFAKLRLTQPEKVPIASRQALARAAGGEPENVSETVTAEESEASVYLGPHASEKSQSTSLWSDHDETLGPAWSRFERLAQKTFSSAKPSLRRITSALTLGASVREQWFVVLLYSKTSYPFHIKNVVTIHFDTR